MIVDFNSDPKNSIIYTSSIILEYLKSNTDSQNIENIFKYCMLKQMDYSTFFLSVDWLFLIGVIKEINDENEVILCD
ncbi:ABC-three component system middle component 6 [Clostridium sp.]|uniref:ABC-three component system middle component 6 n=1 Tax=Clostridium sp. TaxID=1506 RepID=UPI00260C770D|nr:ABC-three component system middle component 6 [Clostridium sp.]